jgi:hypothetical protein
MVMPMYKAADVVTEVRDLQDAVRAWARNYSVRYREAPAPKPGIEDAVEDLRRWTRAYSSFSALETPTTVRCLAVRMDDDADGVV